MDNETFESRIQTYLIKILIKHDRLFDLSTKKKKIGELLATLLFLSLLVRLVLQLCLSEHLLGSEDCSVCMPIPQNTAEEECHCVDAYSTTSHFFGKR